MISAILTWLAAAVALPRWAIVAGAVALCAWLGVAVFAGWWLVFVDRLGREDEHD